MPVVTMNHEQHHYFTQAIAEMRRLYAIPDDGHIVDEYRDADDIARDVAELLGDLIDKSDRDTFWHYDECPHCGRHDDWGDIEWQDPLDDVCVAFARCPHCGGEHKFKFALVKHVPVEG